MKQDQILKTEEQTQQDQNVEQFEAIKAQAVTKKRVKVKYKACCGCGCNYIDVYRTVDINSTLKDGDEIFNFNEDTDVWAE